MRDFDLDVNIARQNDIIYHMKILGGIKDVIGQRYDVILRINPGQNRIAEESKDHNNLLSNMAMETTLISNDSDNFQSCYNMSNQSTVYHDTSQFGMQSVFINESVIDPNFQTAY